MTTVNSINTYIVPTAANEVTMPSQPCFLGILAVAVNTITGNGTVYLLGDTDLGAALTEKFDQNADFNPGTSAGAIFTAPVSGRYFLTSNVTFKAVTAAMTLNNCAIHTSNIYHLYPLCNPGSFRDTSNYTTLSTAVVADMDAADTAVIELQISNGVGDTAGVHGWNNSVDNTSFGGSLLC